MVEVKDTVKRLQRNLNSIRKIAGWTTQDLASKLGLTKQTISNLENQKTEMSLVQYIAIRSLLDHEMATNKENVFLPQVIYKLLDEPDDEIELTEEVQSEVATPKVGSNADEPRNPFTQPDSQEKKEGQWRTKRTEPTKQTIQEKEESVSVLASAASSGASLPVLLTLSAALGAPIGGAIAGATLAAGTVINNSIRSDTSSESWSSMLWDNDKSNKTQKP